MKFLKKKRYLSGIDWIICTLDYMTKRAASSGNVSQIVLQLSGRLEADKINQLLFSYLSNYPIVNGFVKRAWNLAPYWFIPKAFDPKKVDFNVSTAISEEDLWLKLTENTNQPFETKNKHLSFSLVYLEDKSYFAMKFDHKLLDARGAEGFLSRFNKEVSSLAEAGKQDCLYPVNLDKWQEKFKSGQHVNRLFISLRESEKMARLPVPVGSNNSRFIYKTFSRDQSRNIIEKADQKAGYLMTFPYLLGVSAKAMHQLFLKKGTQSNHYIIPVNFDIRHQGKVNDSLFFNHLSFAYFKLMTKQCSDINELFSSIKKQLYSQVSQRISYHIEQASLLMRIAPLSLLSKLIKIPLRGELASYSFSYIADSGYSESSFIGVDVENIHHMPRVPILPGVGIFFTRFNGKINLIISYFQGVLFDQEAEDLVNALSEDLNG